MSWRNKTGRPSPSSLCWRACKLFTWTPPKLSRYSCWCVEQHEADLLVYGLMSPTAVAQGASYPQSLPSPSCSPSARRTVLQLCEALVPEAVLLTDVLAPTGPYLVCWCRLPHPASSRFHPQLCPGSLQWQGVPATSAGGTDSGHWDCDWHRVYVCSQCVLSVFSVCSQCVLSVFSNKFICPV